jgi:hypothetical protein
MFLDERTKLGEIRIQAALIRLRIGSVGGLL